MPMIDLFTEYSVFKTDQRQVVLDKEQQHISFFGASLLRLSVTRVTPSCTDAH